MVAAIPRLRFRKVCEQSSLDITKIIIESRFKGRLLPISSPATPTASMLPSTQRPQIAIWNPKELKPVAHV